MQSWASSSKAGSTTVQRLPLGVAVFTATRSGAPHENREARLYLFLGVLFRVRKVQTKLAKSFGEIARGTTPRKLPVGVVYPLSVGNYRGKSATWPIRSKALDEPTAFSLSLSFV